VPIDLRKSGADSPSVSGELVQLCDGLNRESGDSCCASNISLPSCSELPDIEQCSTLSVSARLMRVNASPYAREIERKSRTDLLDTGSRKARRYL
jgi:hypothetical protein